jgi:pSer/pThr/pTyr-binding forkhead associated (FHA) protein
MIVSPETAERERSAPPYGAPYVFVLTVVDGPEPTLVHRIAARETVIGREPDADFVIADETISKRHCLFRTEAAVCTLVDLESRNGTRINRRVLRPGTAQRLRHLDEIEIGGVRLLLLTGKFRQPRGSARTEP